MKRLIMVVFLVIIYQVMAMVLMYNSSVFNLAAYYTHPPLRAGNIELQRLPMLGGETIAIYFLRNSKEKEIKKIVDNGELSMSAILSSYKGERVFNEDEARHRAMVVADAFIKNGYDLRRCENDGRSVARTLDEWGMLDNINRSFLERYLSREELFACSSSK